MIYCVFSCRSFFASDQPEPASVSATFSVDDLKLALATLSPGEYAKLFWAMAPNIREEDVECEPGKGFTMPVLEKIGIVSMSLRWFLR